MRELKLIRQIASVEELYRSKGAPTGEMIVDAVVEFVKCKKTHSAEEVALHFNQKRVWISGALQMLVGVPLQERKGILDNARQLKLRNDEPATKED